MELFSIRIQRTFQLVSTNLWLKMGKQQKVRKKSHLSKSFFVRPS